MDRRDSLKTLALGSLVTGGLLSAGCKPDLKIVETVVDNRKITIGRTEAELERDLALLEEQFFDEKEMQTLSLLSDIIIPADEKSASASVAGVPDFIEFMAKDIPEMQVKLRGGLAWLAFEAQNRFGKSFAEISDAERINIVDDIAYPEKEKPGFTQGTKFFSMMRFLTMTGFYTSKEGIKDLDYQGNIPNSWDGVPEDELKRHGFSLPEKYKDLYVNFETRGDIAKWDDEGNLIA